MENTHELKTIDPEIDCTTFPDRLVALRNLGQTREMFPSYDWQLDFICETGRKIYNDPIERLVFRSNVARVSVRRGRLRKVLWDEAFFDMLLMACVASGAGIDGQSPDALAKEVMIAMFRDGGTALISARPFRALVLQEAAESLRRGRRPEGFRFNDRAHSHIADMFRIARNFCLLHEVGHLAEADEQQRLLDDKNLSVLEAPYLDQGFARRARMAEGMGSVREHLALIRRAFQSPLIRRELRADIYAMNLLFMLEFGWIDESPSTTPEADKAQVAVLAYHALAILHYVQSNMEFIARYAGTDESGRPLPLERKASETRGVRMATVRGDMRLFLAATLPHQYLDNGGDLNGTPETHQAIREMRQIVPDYGKEYRQLCLTAMASIFQCKREAIFREEGKLTERLSVGAVQRAALRNIGWIS